MEQATEYKKYLEFLRKATQDAKKNKKPIKPKKLACGGMGIAVRGGNFEGVK
mgnify:CR=1 FL=1|jgi:hypothetical protein|tara:strand:- start:283 stop:438 length:156 start_codon:yes stop_codon:yes gene_type:complete